MVEDSGAGEAKQEEDRRLEAWKMIYDNLKHLTTLATATAVVELAIYREQLVGAYLVVISLVLLSCCVAICLVRMDYAANHIRSGENPKDTSFVSGLYVSGLVSFALYALEPSVRVWFVSFGALVAYMAVLLKNPGWDRRG